MVKAVSNILKRGIFMAVLSAMISSAALMRTINIKVFLPADRINMDGTYDKEEKKYKTLYLLHGVLGSENDWLYRTNLIRYAEDKQIAVVMPAGENSYYIDQPDVHANYEKMIAEDLVYLTRRLFPLSDKREDTMIGGLSMGGYGALHIGLKYPDIFGRIIGLSSADMTEIPEQLGMDAQFFRQPSFFKRIFGDVAAAKESSYNLSHLAKETAAAGIMPEIYMACGLQDSLLASNQRLYQSLKQLGYKVTYCETDRSHSWDFWDAQIKAALSLIEDEGKHQGMHSGNVGV